MDTVCRTSPDRGESSRRTMALRSNNRDLWDKLDDSIVESILARTPTVDMFCSQLVCRRWNSLIHSPSFQITYQQLPRRPWFYMLDEQSTVNVVYDMEVDNWRHTNLPIPTDINGSPRAPVAANGSLMCFKSEAGLLIACNPLTGLARSIWRPATNGSIRAIAMYVNRSIFKVVIIFKKGHDYFLKVFSSVENTWGEVLLRKISVCNNVEDNNPNGIMLLQGQEDEDMVEIERISIIEWTPMKVHPAVTVLGSDGQLMVYYLSPRGRLVGCDTHQNTISMYPRLFPKGEICAVDMVECDNRILALVLKEDLALGTAMLWVWEFKPEEKQWKLLAAMPPNMSHVYYPLQADINCAGQGEYIMVCVTSENSDFNQVVMYNIIEDSWVELPRCLDRRGEHFKRFVCAYSFVPDIYANV